MDEVQRIQCPTLIVASGKDAIGDVSAYERMHQRIPRSILVRYDVAVHNMKAMGQPRPAKQCYVLAN
jgi:pimeloyl-ACP methyl ester carboxylesterase